MTKPVKQPSQSDTRRNQAAVRDVLPALVALLALELVLDLVGMTGRARLLNLVPLLPALWLIWAQVRVLRRADELQRVRLLEAMAMGFGAMVVLSLAGGLLDAADLGDPRQSLQVTFIGGVLVWVIVLASRTRRDG